MPAARRRHRQLLPTVAAATVALALAACGNDSTLPPDVTTPAPRLGSSAERFDAEGVTFASPEGWTVQRGAPPLVATLASGRAVVSIFLYPRTEPLPRTRTDLDDAAKALAGAAGQRDATFAERARGRIRVDGRPGVVLRGTQTIAGQPRTVRSTHVYAFGGEVVVDAFAPAEDFKRVDAEAFRPLVKSLRLTQPG